MTYNIAVWEGDLPSSDADATSTFNELVDGIYTPAPPTPKIREYVETLLDRWPDITSEAGENSPWGDGPLMNNARGHIFYFSLIWSQAETAAAYCAELADSFGLICYDPQEERLFTRTA